MTPDPRPASLADLDATDAWLDAVARRTPPLDDELAGALVSWLDRIDEGLVSLPVVVLTPLADRAGAPADACAEPLRLDRLTRRRRRIAVFAAVSVLAVAGTGVAAASPGSLLYPVHQKLFGTVAVVPDPLDQAGALLGQAQGFIDAAKPSHHLGVDRAANVRSLLAQALGILKTVRPSERRTTLLALQSSLADELIQLTAIAPEGPRGSTPPGNKAPVATEPAQEQGGSSRNGSADQQGQAKGSDDTHHSEEPSAGPTESQTDSGGTSSDQSSKSGDGGSDGGSSGKGGPSPEPSASS